MSGLRDAARARRPLTRDISRITGLVFVIVAISLLHARTHQSAEIWHGLLLRLYYIPILVAAYWYGAFGGLLVALGCSLAYVPHLREQIPAVEAGRYAEIVVFHLIGLTTGLLATTERRVSERYQKAARTLEAANRELKDSYEQLQRADRLKTLGEVAAGLAHELRHPLASIGGALEIIEARSQPDTPEAEFSRLAMIEVQRLDNLVWDFLRYARPHDPDLRSMPLDVVIDRVFSLLRVEADRAGVVLEGARGPTLPEVLIDAQQIEQVLLNVILNAIQSSPAGTVVRVCEQMDQHDAIVDVIDEGPGISAAHLPHIFTPFFTTREKGTGLGLAIASRIVVAHHGSLDIHETSQRGTCVRLRLPSGASGQPHTVADVPQVEA